MSASESSPLTTNLQESIENLITETVRRSQTNHEEEQQKLRDALQQALNEIEDGQTAMSRAADTLRAALNTSSAVVTAPESQVAPVAAEPPASTEGETPANEQSEDAVDDTVTGPHQLDVIAHDVSIGIATGLQSMLRGRSEVTSAQTREFVNGELRLRLELNSGLDIASIKEWIGEQNGRIMTHTDSVIELRFGE